MCLIQITYTQTVVRIDQKCARGLKEWFLIGQIKTKCMNFLGNNVRSQVCQKYELQIAFLDSCPL